MGERLTAEQEAEIRAYYAHEGEPPVSFYRPEKIEDDWFVAQPRVDWHEGGFTWHYVAKGSQTSACGVRARYGWANFFADFVKCKRCVRVLAKKGGSRG